MLYIKKNLSKTAITDLTRKIVANATLINCYQFYIYKLKPKFYSKLEFTTNN